ncbi:MAG TPA: histidine kinase [Flavilitoribacter sp.]|nr:histidine kinase [Flavilitoribacter sp.]HMQ91437.1 histidine kinase [Flavilitoribacter sp.]
MNWKQKLPIPYWLGIVIAVVLAAIFTFKSYLGYLLWNEQKNFYFSREFFLHLVNFTFWAFILPIVNSVVIRYRIQSPSWREKGMAILASLILAALHEVITSIEYHFPYHYLVEAYPPEKIHRLIRIFPFAWFQRLLEYWVLYAILMAAHYQKQFQAKALELAQTENQLSNARLNALKLQLQPHFLFNTLNTISSLMDIDVKSAQKVVSRLGGLLRSVLDKEKGNLIPLGQEFEFVRNYLDIEQIRFNDRLEVRYDLEEGIHDALVPSLILQPLVENAIKHGFARRVDNGAIEVKARNDSGLIIITVRDDGEGASHTDEDLFSGGIGLQNVNNRLALIYGENAGLSVKNLPEKGFEARITIPYQKVSDK